MNNNGNIDYKSELIRKAIHLNSLSIPVIYYYISKETALWILIPMMLFFLSVDIIRYYNPNIGRLFYKIFGVLLRKHEKDEKKKRLNGATNLLISAVICVLFLPKILVITSFAVLIISDTLAALIGRKFGKTKFLRKSLEGTAAFFISAVIVVILSPKINYLSLEYVIGFLGVFIGAIIENLSIEFDDNITIPVSISLVMWLLYTLLLPNVNLNLFV